MLSMTSIRYNHAVQSDKGLPFIHMAMSVVVVSCSAHKPSDL